MKRCLTSFFLLLFTPLLLAFDPYSNKELESLEKDFVKEINLSNQVIRDPLATTYINEVGKRLTDSIHATPCHFFIVSSNEINAFAGPGGHIGIHVPLILATRNEDELAAVMAHELAHVKLHHLYQMIEHEKMMRIPTTASMLAAMALGIINPMLASGAMAATLSGAAQNSINFTRSHEKEADRIGIQMLSKAGFNPDAMAQFFGQLHEAMRYYDVDNIPAILRTHPLDEERIAEAEDRASHLPHVPHSTSISYELFKTFIRYRVTTESKLLADYYHHQPNPDSIANQYGMALADLSANQFQRASKILTPLLSQLPNQPFLVFAAAQAHMGLKKPNTAITELNQLAHVSSSDDALALELADAYIQEGHPNLAAQILTKAFRRYPQNLLLCHALAEAESKNHRPGYAYFILAQCDHLQGQDRLALQRLKLALTLSKTDSYLKDRVEAKTEEIKLEIQ